MVNSRGGIVSPSIPPSFPPSLSLSLSLLSVPLSICPSPSQEISSQAEGKQRNFFFFSSRNVHLCDSLSSSIHWLFLGWPDPQCQDPALSRWHDPLTNAPPWPVLPVPPVLQVLVHPSVSGNPSWAKRAQVVTWFYLDVPDDLYILVAASIQISNFVIGFLGSDGCGVATVA